MVSHDNHARSIEGCAPRGYDRFLEPAHHPDRGDPVFACARLLPIEHWKVYHDHIAALNLGVEHWRG